MEVSLGVAIDMFNVGLKVSAEFTVELERSFSETSEKPWSKTENIQFIIPAGKNYKVLQHISFFDGYMFISDSGTLLADIKIFESDTDAFKGEKDFIINKWHQTKWHQTKWHQTKWHQTRWHQTNEGIGYYHDEL